MQDQHSLDISTRHHPRQLHTLGLWAYASLHLKTYLICAEPDEFERSRQEQFRPIIQKQVSKLETGATEPLPGFSIIHIGSEGISFLIHWWREGCILCQDYSRQPFNGTDPLASVRHNVVGCTWELSVIDHERRSWQANMMSEAPNLDAYLRDWMPADTV